MEIGIDSFAEAQLDNGKSYSENSAQSISDLLDRIEHADKVGLDVFGIGEHYRKEFLDSANSVILSAAASRTKNIRLTSAVTVLSAADPVRAFQNFATLDLVSSGRAEMVVGRGSFTESYPLFGLNLNEYEEIPIHGQRGRIFPVPSTRTQRASHQTQSLPHTPPFPHHAPTPRVLLANARRGAVPNAVPNYRYEAQSNPPQQTLRPDPRPWSRTFLTGQFPRFFHPAGPMCRAQPHPLG